MNKGKTWRNVRIRDLQKSDSIEIHLIGDSLHKSTASSVFIHCLRSYRDNQKYINELEQELRDKNRVIGSIRHNYRVMNASRDYLNSMLLAE